MRLTFSTRLWLAWKVFRGQLITWSGTQDRIELTFVSSEELSKKLRY